VYFKRVYSSLGISSLVVGFVCNYSTESPWDDILVSEGCFLKKEGVFLGRDRASGISTDALRNSDASTDDFMLSGAVLVVSWVILLVIKSLCLFLLWLVMKLNLVLFLFDGEIFCEIGAEDSWEMLLF